MGEKRPRVGSVWEIHTGVVRVTGHEPDTVRLEWESGYYPAGTSDSCGPMMFTHAKPLSPDPWESDASASPQAATGPAAGQAKNHSADDAKNEDAVKRNVVPGTKQYMYGNDGSGPVVAVGMRVHLLAKGPGTVESVRHEGAWSSTVLFDNGQRQPMQLTREGRIHNTNSWSVIREPKPEVRVGQVWRFPSAPSIEYTVHAIDGAAVALRFHGDQEAYSYVDDCGLLRGGTLIRDVEEPAISWDEAVAFVKACQENGMTFPPPGERRLDKSCALLGIPPREPNESDIELRSRAIKAMEAAYPEAVAAHRVSFVAVRHAFTRDRVIRPGQRYSDGRHEYAFLDHDGGTFLARRDDGLRVLVPRSRVVECAWRLVSGPVVVETDREALERVAKLEAEYAPAGETAGTWLRKLLGACEVSGPQYSVRGPSVTALRAFARDRRGNLGPWNAMTMEEAGR